MTETPHPMDGFDLTGLRGMLDRFEDALREARLASQAAEGLAGIDANPPSPEPGGVPDSM